MRHSRTQSLPMALDVRLAFLPKNTHLSFVGQALILKRHKQIQVHPSKRVADILYHYRVCHFGARFSALVAAHRSIPPKATAQFWNYRDGCL